MEWLSAPWVSSFAGYAIGAWSSWFRSSAACACHCACDFSGQSTTDRELIGVLKGQLDRCGPDQLKVPPLPAPVPCICEAPSAAVSLHILVFTAGVCVGCFLALWVSRWLTSRVGDGAGSSAPGPSARARRRA